MAWCRYRSVIVTPQDLTEPRWVERTACAGLNTIMLHGVRLPEDIAGLIDFQSSHRGRRFFEACRDAGIRVEYQMHTASWLVPRMYFRRNPDWFRMDVSGRRVSDCNFCFSSEEAWAVAEERLLELAERLQPETGRYLWFGDDVQEGACHCPKCAHLTPADQAMIYANRLASVLRLRDARPRVSYLAYHSTLATPATIPPGPGVFLEFAPIRRCYRHAIDDPNCAVNRVQAEAFQRNRSGFGEEDVHVTEYWLDASRHSGWRRPAVAIPVAEEVLERDIAFYREEGVNSIASYAVMCDAMYWSEYGEPMLREFGGFLSAE